MSGKDARAFAALLALSLIVHFLDLGGPALWDRDEPRNAQCTREMLQRGDWVVPFFNGEMRDHKPVLLYWLMMASYGVFGINEFAARAPSALLGSLTVLLTYAIGHRIWGSAAGFWSGVCLTTFTLFVLVTRAATPDAALIFCSTLAICLFVLFSPDFQKTHGPENAPEPFPQQQTYGALIYAAMAVGCLAKGPVAVVLPTAVLGMYCLWRRLPPDASTGVATAQRFRRFAKRGFSTFQPRHFLATCWSMRPLTAIIVVLLIAGPWYFWVGLRTDGVWLSGFLGTHNFSRAVTAMEGHAAGPWFYPLVLLAGTFPWSVLTIPTVLVIWYRWCEHQEHGVTQSRADRGLLLVVCWIGVFVVSFSLLATKLPNYVAPCYPAIALLLGSTIATRVSSTSFAGIWVHIGLATMLVVGLAVVCGLFVVLDSQAPTLRWLSLIGWIPVVCACLGWVQNRLKQFMGVAWTMLCCATCFTIGLVIVAAGRISELQRADDFLIQQLSDRHRANTALLSLGPVEPSWVFYAGRPIHELDAHDWVDVERQLSTYQEAFVLSQTDRGEPLDLHQELHRDLALRPLGHSQTFLGESDLHLTHARAVAVAQKRAAHSDKR